jgi:hypothetical protein
MKYIKAIVYGPAGRGKTTLIKTGLGNPSLEPILLVDFEGGVNDSIGSVCRFVDIDAIGNPVIGMIDVVTIRNGQDLDKVHRAVDKHKSVYNTVVLDSITEMHKLLLDQLAGTDTAARASLLSVRMPQLQEYGRAGNIMRHVVNKYKLLPDMHVLFLAGTRFERNPETGETKNFPDLLGQLAFSISGLVSMVGYFGMMDVEGKEERCISFYPSKKFEGKVRDEFGSFPPIIVNPTLSEICNLLNGEPNGK